MGGFYEKFTYKNSVIGSIYCYDTTHAKGKSTIRYWRSDKAHGN
jgi:hypothetical protein